MFLSQIGQCLVIIANDPVLDFRIKPVCKREQIGFHIIAPAVCKFIEEMPSPVGVFEPPCRCGQIRNVVWAVREVECLGEPVAIFAQCACAIAIHCQGTTAVQWVLGLLVCACRSGDVNIPARTALEILAVIRLVNQHG